MKNTGGDEDSSSSPKSNESPHRRHTTGGSSTVTRPLAGHWRNPIVMGRPGVSAFRPYVRPPQKPRPIQPRPQNWPAPPIAADPSDIGGSMFQTRPDVSAFRPYVRPPQNPRPQNWPTPPIAAGPSGFGSGSMFQARPAVSAFRPYVRPPQNPSPQNWPAPPTAAGPSGIGGSTFQTRPGLAVPIGGGAGVMEGGIRIGGTPTVRKRNRGDGGSRAAAGRNNPPEHGGGGGDQGGAGDQVVNCSICGRSFGSTKALFGHMRSHPDRGWKGARPPPTFRAADEFTDLPGVNRREDVEASQPEDGGEGGSGGGGSKKDEGLDLNNSPPAKE